MGRDVVTSDSNGRAKGVEYFIARWNCCNDRVRRTLEIVRERRPLITCDTNSDFLSNAKQRATTTRRTRKGDGRSRTKRQRSISTVERDHHHRNVHGQFIARIIYDQFFSSVWFRLIVVREDNTNGTSELHSAWFGSVPAEAKLELVDIPLTATSPC